MEMKTEALLGLFQKKLEIKISMYITVISECSIFKIDTPHLWSLFGLQPQLASS